MNLHNISNTYLVSLKFKLGLAKSELIAVSEWEPSVSVEGVQGSISTRLLQKTANSSAHEPVRNKK